MARVSPLRKLHQQAEAAMAPYGPPESDILVVGTFGELELEYAALRKGAVLLDQPYRATLEITGADRPEFLNRMLTQELKDLAPFHTRRSFWLSRKGRIDADLRVIELGSRTLLDVDTLAAERTLATLSAFVITEAVHIRSIAEESHRFGLHGPQAAALLRAVSKPVAGAPLSDLAAGTACVVTIAGKEVTIDRDDSTGEPGFEALVALPDAAAVYEQLLEIGLAHDGNGGSASGSGFGLRQAGWHAFNIARIEAGHPIYNLDFGVDSLPHETGVIRDRVSFIKGCYLGQEIVARMESRGHPKQQLVALRFDQSQTRTSLGEPRQPVTGSHVWAAKAPDGDPVGAVTSSTLSPMLGGEPVCFAMVKFDHTPAGTQLLVAADETRLAATVQPQLAFWHKS